jgi:DNA-binding NarL/FixJ family response regulator
MNEPLLQPSRLQLKVGIVANDAERKTALEQIVTDAGHQVVEVDEAQVVLADRELVTVRPTSSTQTIGFEELAERNDHPLLTPRELEVLTAIGEGMSNKIIARKLGISLHTVKFHVESLFRKLSVRTRAEAVARGLVVIPA